jgi:hypothetical protein
MAEHRVANAKTMSSILAVRSKAREANLVKAPR